jgi:hypothetical protein
MKQAVATTLTLALIVGALYLGRNSTEKSNFSAASPADCLEQMYLAAERGDVDAYLACFTGVQRQRLDVELRTESREAFAAAIAEPFGSLKGRAINDLSTEPADGERAQLEAERIYPQYNERQTYGFRREGGAWRIESLGVVRRLQPPVPYGTPVYAGSSETINEVAREQ